MSLEFRAVGSGDDYEVFGLLRRVDGSGNFIDSSTYGTANTSNNIVLFAERGADTGGFKTVTYNNLQAGDYRFEFVGGTYDGSGGLAVGSNLYVDNIRLVSSTTVTDSIATTIAQQVSYQSTAQDSPTSRTVTIEAVDANGASTSDTIQLDITQTNDAPNFTGNATLSAIAEDTIAPAGNSVTTLLGALYSDPDNTYTPTDTLGGIVVVGDASAPSEGTWEYSTDGGSGWQAVGSVSASNGLLLSAASLLRFVPAPDYIGTPGALSVHAVDSTFIGGYTDGASRATFDVTSDDSAAETSAVSASAVTLGTSITASNDAPVLTPGTGQDLTSITEDDTGNTGQTIASLLATITDPDPANAGTASIKQGVAIYATAITGTGSGVWQYQVDSGSWTPFGTVSETGALLLKDTDKVRFVPDTLNGTTASFSYYAWDQASGSAGSTANVTSRGGDTPFSLNGDTTSITVTDAADPPTLDLDADNSSSATGNDYQTTFKARGTEVAVVDSDITITDPDGSMMAEARVAITGGAFDNLFGTDYETLSARAAGAESATITSFSAPSGATLTITGNGTPEVIISGAGTLTDYQSALQTVFYNNANTSPFNGDRTLTVTLTDSEGGEITANTKVAVQWVPVVDLNGSSDDSTNRDYTVAYTEDDPGLVIANPTATITDQDGNIVSLTLTLTNPLNGAEEYLYLDPTQEANLTGDGITLTGNGTHELTFTGSGDATIFQYYLRGVKYLNTAEDTDTSAHRIVVVNATDNDGNDSLAATATITMAPINDAPAGADKTLTIDEDTTHIFTQADFGFTDSNDLPPNSLLAVKITSLPALGSLTLAGNAVSAGQFVSAADIAAGELVYTPVSEGSGNDYARFTFQVQDNGGTANGGVDLDASANTITIDVDPLTSSPA